MNISGNAQIEACNMNRFLRQIQDQVGQIFTLGSSLTRSLLLKISQQKLNLYFLSNLYLISTQNMQLSESLKD